MHFWRVLTKTFSSRRHVRMVLTRPYNRANQSYILGGSMVNSSLQLCSRKNFTQLGLVKQETWDDTIAGPNINGNRSLSSQHQRWNSKYSWLCLAHLQIQDVSGCTAQILSTTSVVTFICINFPSVSQWCLDSLFKRQRFNSHNPLPKGKML